MPDTPPAAALLAVAQHADVALRELDQLAQEHKLPRSSFGVLLGNLFSETRERLADRLIEGERSYRGTLLGMRHGVDVVHMVELTAREAGSDSLANWAATWLQRREPLVRDVERQLAWYATHADRALARATSKRARAPVASPDPEPADQDAQWDKIDEASAESFPASDPPARWAGKDLAPPTLNGESDGDATRGL